MASSSTATSSETNPNQDRNHAQQGQCDYWAQPAEPAFQFFSPDHPWRAHVPQIVHSIITYHGPVPLRRLLIGQDDDESGANVASNLIAQQLAAEHASSGDKGSASPSDIKPGAEQTVSTSRPQKRKETKRFRKLGSDAKLSDDLSASVAGNKDIGSALPTLVNSQTQMPVQAIPLESSSATELASAVGVCVSRGSAEDSLRARIMSWAKSGHIIPDLAHAALAGGRSYGIPLQGSVAAGKGQTAASSTAQLWLYTINSWMDAKQWFSALIFSSHTWWTDTDELVRLFLQAHDPPQNVPLEQLPLHLVPPGFNAWTQEAVQQHRRSVQMALCTFAQYASDELAVPPIAARIGRFVQHLKVSFVNLEPLSPPLPSAPRLIATSVDPDHLVNTLLSGGNKELEQESFKSSWLALPAERVATQLALLEWNLFAAIRTVHVVQATRGEEKKQQNAGQGDSGETDPAATGDNPLQRLVDLSNRIRMWLVHTILSVEDPARRLAATKDVLGLSKELLRLHCFNAVTSVFSSIEHPAVSRLRSTAEALDQFDGKIGKKLSTVCSPLNNHEGYRSLVNELGREQMGADDQHTSCIPCVAVVLKDAMQLDIRQKSRTKDGQINLHKFVGVHQLIFDVQRWQHEPPPVQEDPDVLHRICKSINSTPNQDEKALFEWSLSIQPRLQSSSSTSALMAASSPVPSSTTSSAGRSGRLSWLTQRGRHSRQSLGSSPSTSPSWTSSQRSFHFGGVSPQRKRRSRDSRRASSVLDTDALDVSPASPSRGPRRDSQRRRIVNLLQMLADDVDRAEKLRSRAQAYGMGRGLQHTLEFASALADSLVAKHGSRLDSDAYAAVTNAFPELGAFEDVDADGDGFVSEEEVVAAVAKVMDAEAALLWMCRRKQVDVSTAELRENPRLIANHLAFDLLADEADESQDAVDAVSSLLAANNLLRVQLSNVKRQLNTLSGGSADYVISRNVGASSVEQTVADLENPQNASKPTTATDTSVLKSSRACEEGLPAVSEIMHLLQGTWPMCMLSSETLRRLIRAGKVELLSDASQEHPDHTKLPRDHVAFVVRGRCNVYAPVEESDGSSGSAAVALDLGPCSSMTARNFAYAVVKPATVLGGSQMGAEPSCVLWMVSNSLLVSFAKATAIPFVPVQPDSLAPTSVATLHESTSPDSDQSSLRESEPTPPIVQVKSSSSPALTRAALSSRQRTSFNRSRSDPDTVNTPKRAASTSSSQPGEASDRLSNAIQGLMTRPPGRRRTSDGSPTLLQAQEEAKAAALEARRGRLARAVSEDSQEVSEIFSGKPHSSEPGVLSVVTSRASTSTATSQSATSQRLVPSIQEDENHHIEDDNDEQSCSDDEVTDI